MAFSWQRSASVVPRRHGAPHTGALLARGDVVAIDAATEQAVPHLPSAAAAVPQATAEAQDPAVVPRSLQTPAQRTATYLQNLVGQGRDLGIRLPSPPYFAINADKPTLVQNACDQVVATSDAPLSKPAAAWIKKMQVANGDGWNKVTRDFESRRMEVLWQTGAGRGRQSALRPPTPQNTACPPHLNLPFPPQQPLPRPLGRPSCFSASAS